MTVIGDSMIRGLPKIFYELRYISASWTFHVNEGEEALNVACTASNGLVMYCTAGNGLWKKKEQLANMLSNIRSFDPNRVVVVFLGTADLWSRLAAKRATNATFFEDARRALLQRRVRVAEVTTFMECLEYADTWGHPSKKAQVGLVHELMAVFEEVTQRPLAQDAVVENALEVTQRPQRRSSPPPPPPPPPQRPQDPAALLPRSALRGTGAGGDVLEALTEYEGWEDDLRKQHGVLHPNLNQHPPEARKGWFWCEECKKDVPSWAQVPTHIQGKRHQANVGAVPSITTSSGCGGTPPPVAFVAAPDTEGWPPLLRYAQAGKLDEAASELRADVDPNATAPGDDRTPLFWAAWEGHHLVVQRLLQEPRVRDLAKADCKGLRDVPPAACSPLCAAHDRWGEDSKTFAAFGLLHALASASQVA